MKPQPYCFKCNHLLEGKFKKSSLFICEQCNVPGTDYNSLAKITGKLRVSIRKRLIPKE